NVMWKWYEAPFAAERERYLQHCADLGATYATLRQKGTELLWIARLLDKNAPQGVSAEQLEEVVRRRTSVHKGRTTAQRVINIARPWLRFLGWWREQPIEVPFQGLLNRYITWMRDERGFTTESVRQLQCQAKMFLQWYAKNRRQLSDLRPADIDHYFASEGVQRWSRISTRNVASALLCSKTGGLRRALGQYNSEPKSVRSGISTLRAQLVGCAEDLGRHLDRRPS